MLQLGHDSFQVLLAGQAEELQAVPLDVAGVEEDGWLLGDDGTQHALSLKPREGPEVLAIEPQEIEEYRLGAATAA